MAGEYKTTLTAYGLFLLGANLTRLEWALATIDACHGGQSSYIATFLEPMRGYSTVRVFEGIGTEAAYWHNLLSNNPSASVDAQTRDKLRSVITRWHSLISERTADLYLATPSTILKPENLLKGIPGILMEEDAAILSPMEKIDLNEACRCIIMGCSTAAEFIVLRSAESLLRRWYEKKTGKQIERKPWGGVIDQLEAEYPDEKQRPKEIALLQYLRLRRNEVNHPERTSSQQDAETTLMNVCSLTRGIRVVWSKLPEAPVHDG